MIIGIDRVVELIRTKKLIDGLDESNMNFEGCGVDLRLGELHEMEDGEGFLHIAERKTPNYKLLAKFDSRKSTKVKLSPRKFYIGVTEETINTLEDLIGWFIPRTTLYANGVTVYGVRTDPGFSGKFKFFLVNNSGRPFEIEMGARIANMVFHTVEGKTNLYQGQWKGDRTYIADKETQTMQKEKV
jgi:dCTP deaminase